MLEVAPTHAANKLSGCKTRASPIGDGPGQIMTQHDLTRAIAVLPPSQRHVFLLRDLEERSAAGVAAMLGLTIMTVKSRLHLARATLRQTLQPWHEEGC